MRGALVAATMVLAGPMDLCGHTDAASGSDTGAAATASAPPGPVAQASAAPASAAAAPAVAQGSKVPTQGAPPAGPCAELAQRCRKCPPGAVQTACNFAVSAGQLDREACVNALADKDIKSQCGGGAPTPAAPASTTPPAAGGDPCGQLAQKCPRCPPGVAQTACNFALAAGRLNPAACANALADKDIKGQCN